MAEKTEKSKEKKQQKIEKPVKAEKPIRKRPGEDETNEILVRILGYDVPGSRNIYVGLTRIKGISWAISNAICLNLKMPRSKKISELTNEDIVKIEDLLKNLNVYDFMKNRRNDPEGQTAHHYGTDLEMKKEFDIKRLKEIRSYKGVRHASRLPVRGQRTRSHFRMKKTTGGGIKRKTTNDKKE